MSKEALCHKMLSTLCPMHIVLGRDGKITFAGPTAQKICPEGLIGRQFLDVFEIKRPREITRLDDLYKRAGTKLNVRFRASPEKQLKGVVTEGPQAGETTINLSFGISVVDAVQIYGLTAADFAATDLTVEMLYLVEAKSAAMEASRDLNQRLQMAREAAEQQAQTDVLTGLKNRRAMDHMLAALTDVGEPFTLMHLDLDFFKSVNDTLGHAAGDHVLKQAAEVMTAETRKLDMVARVGGDEFVILLHGNLEPETVSKVAQRIIDRLKQPIMFEGKKCQVSASIGIAVATPNGNHCVDQVLSDADAALYTAKGDGRGKYAFFGQNSQQC